MNKYKIVKETILKPNQQNLLKSISQKKKIERKIINLYFLCEVKRGSPIT